MLPAVAEDEHVELGQIAGVSEGSVGRCDPHSDLFGVLVIDRHHDGRARVGRQFARRRSSVPRRLPGKAPRTRQAPSRTRRRSRRSSGRRCREWRCPDRTADRWPARRQTHWSQPRRWPSPAPAAAGGAVIAPSDGAYPPVVRSTAPPFRDQEVASRLQRTNRDSPVMRSRDDQRSSGCYEDHPRALLRHGLGRNLDRLNAALGKRQCAVIRRMRRPTNRAHPLIPSDTLNRCVVLPDHPTVRPPDLWLPRPALHT